MITSNHNNLLIQKLKVLKDHIYLVVRQNEGGSHFLDVYAMIDPPHPGVPKAVLKCQSR